MNEFTIEDDGLHTRLVYRLSEDEEIDTYSFRMMEAAGAGWLVPLASCDSAKNGVRQIGYDITDMAPVSLLASGGVGISLIADIFGQIISSVSASEKYLFDSSMFVLCGDYIYFQHDTGRIKLLLLPAKTGIPHESFRERLRELFKKVLYDAKYLSEKDGIRLIELLNYINNERDFTVKGLTDILYDIMAECKTGEEALKDKPPYAYEDDFCSNISGDLPVYSNYDSDNSDNLTEKKARNVNKFKRFFGSIFNSESSGEKNDTYNEGNICVDDIECVNLVSEKKDSFEDTKEIILPDIQNSFPYLLRKYDGSKIIINKELFRIGKEERYADYRIIDNAAVSRMHAEIKCENGVYTVTDQDSLNHTYVNKNVAGPYVPIEINSGDTISFADDEYIFYN